MSADTFIPVKFGIPKSCSGLPVRVVATVEELQRWCDPLAAQWHQTRTLGAHLHHHLHAA